VVRPVSPVPSAGERAVAAAIVMSIVLGLGATVVLLAAYGFDPVALAHPGSLANKGEQAAELLRWGALLDMASYLPIAVPVLYLHGRLGKSGGELIRFVTAAGLAYVLIGAIGGGLLAGGGPPLVASDAGASEAGRETARIALDSLGQAVIVGLFGTLELIPFGGWMLGVGWLLRRDWPRFWMLSVVAALGVLASSVRSGLTGRSLIEIDGLPALIIAAALGLVFVWQLWLAARLWRGTWVGTNPH
jgi:hypothetical protein